MHALSKSVWFLIQPSSLIVGLLLLGMVLGRFMRFEAAGRRLVWIGIILLIGGGILPVGTALIVPLEQRFPAPHGKLPAEPIAGIIVLGGYEDGRITAARGTLTLNEAAERLTETAVLAYRLPTARVIVSGGSGSILREDREATGEIADFLATIGVSRDRITLENRSRTTYENAVFARDLIKPQSTQRWLLVTSAAHMPRAVGAFRSQGFDVVAWPADFRTKDSGDIVRAFASIPAGLRRLDDATQEWLGLLAYFLAGRSDTLFPKP